MATIQPESSGNLLGVRKWLNDQGYGNNDIGYANGNVTLGGKNLISATPQASDNPSQGLYGGSTYATGSALQNALSGYQNTYGKPMVNALDAGSRNTALNNTYNNVNNAVNTASPFQFKQQQQPFSYDANSDVQYQNALKGALANAQVASNNAQSQLGARGIGNSSIASNMSNQIQQKAIGDVTSSVLPSLIEQAYQRYQDQNNNEYRNQVANYGVGQDQIRNQSAFADALNNLGQQEFTNNLNNKNANLNAFQTAGQLTGQVPVGGPKEDWRLLFQGDNATQFNPTLQGQQFQQSVAQQGIENTRANQQLNATLANMTSDNARAAASEARAAGNQQLGSLFDVWDRTGVAPAGIPGVAQGTPLQGKGSTAKPDQFSLDDYNKYIQQNFNSEISDPNNPLGGKVKSFDSAGARKYIIGLGLDDALTDQLLKLNGLPTN